MGALTTAAKNLGLDAMAPNGVTIHSGDPGADGSANMIGSYRSATFASASGGEKALSSDMDITGLTGGQSITYIGFWKDIAGTPVFLGSDQLSAPGDDVAANAAGEFTIKATTTKLSIS